MIRKIFGRIFKKKSTKSHKPESSEEKNAPYTEEEAKKVKERLQGLGYID